MQKSSEFSHEEWIKNLESASKGSPDRCNSEWEWLMQQLDLGPEYFLAIYETLQQGRWRTARNPKAYIKTVAKREALKMGLLSEPRDELVFTSNLKIDDEDISGDEILDFISYRQDSVDPTKGPNGVWRAGEGWDREFGNPRNEYHNYRDFIVSAIPSELAIVQQPSNEFKALVDEINNNTEEFHLHARPLIKPNWEKWAQAADFSEWESRVLDYKLESTSRERALKEQPDEISRKALQAAWKRFDRSGMDRLRAVAKKLP
jgi:hypothetical protein